jgi:acetylornithine/succinyldiaminopimelate/putrescine aminotransferase
MESGNKALNYVSAKQCGLYRSGTLWAHSALPVECHPDMVTTAKPLANGYPIGAVLLRDSVATMTAGMHDYDHFLHRSNILS